MLFTVIPYGATSFARVLEKPVTAARRLLERIRLSMGCLTEIDVMLRIRPHFRSFIPGRTARVRFRALSRVRWKACSQASGGSSSNLPGGGPPLLVTSMSTRPKRLMAADTTSSGPPGPERSVTTGFTSTPVSFRISAEVLSSFSEPREQRVRFAPSRASSNATALPRPVLEPATTAILPFRPRSIPLSYFLK